MDIKVNCIINIFTIIDGKINLLVTNDNNLLNIECNDNLDDSCSKYINDNLELSNYNINQYYTFSEKSENNLKLSVLYIGIINNNDIKLNGKFKFIDISEVNDKYIKKSMEYLRKELISNSTIKKLYPGEFALPEIQKMYENLLEKKYDRRNFRKKLIKLNIIEDLNKFSSTKNGRPAKLYKFKELNGERNLF